MTQETGEVEGVVDAKSRVRLGTLLIYGLPTVGSAFPLFLIQFYYMNYATDVLLIAPAVMGVLFAIGRVWDAVSDPLIGFLSDKTSSRWGRRRPWLLLAIPVQGLCFIAIWMPPSGMHEILIYLWIGILLTGFYTGFTAWDIPHEALGAELTQDHHDRSRIFAVRHVAFMFGIFFAFGGMQYVVNAGEARTAAANLAWISAAVFSLILLAPALWVRERSGFRRRGPSKPFQAIKDVYQNHHARLLLFVFFIEHHGFAVMGIISPYMALYVLKRPDLVGLFPALFVVPSILSVPLWVRLSRRFGKRNTWLFSMVAVACSFGPLVFVQEGGEVFFGVLLVCAGLSAGCGGPIGQSLLVDIMDYDEYKTRERKEGAYSAALGFVIKAANVLIALIVGVALQAAGFEPNVEQSDTVKLTIRALHGILPFTMFAVGATLFRRFSLDEAAYRQIRAELDQRDRERPETEN